MHSRSSSTMTLTDETKRAILSYLPADAKVIATAFARVYHAPFDGRPENWTYSGLEGILVFGRDRITVDPDKRLGTGPGSTIEQHYWFRLVDLISGKGLVWMHQIPETLEYRLDKPFFHDFPGKTRMFGFRFNEDAEANKFYKKVTSRVNTKPSSSRIIKKSTPRSKRLSASMISSPAPGSFVHLAHVGFDKQGGLEVSKDIEPGWTMMLSELQGHGVTKSIVENDRNFVEGFLAGVKASSPKQTQVKFGADRVDIPKTRKTIHRKPALNIV